MELVDRKMELADVEDRVEHMPQSSEDFFTREDRKELYRQTVQGEQTLRALDDIKSTAKENARISLERQDAHEVRIRALEDSRLQFQTQAQTSWRWILLISAAASGIVSFLIKLFAK